MRQTTPTYIKRTQRDYTLAFKLAVVALSRPEQRCHFDNVRPSNIQSVSMRHPLATANLRQQNSSRIDIENYGRHAWLSHWRRYIHRRLHRQR